ncbi:MAG: hypothetical protein CMP12_01645 [Zunongwangia sp.]|uniref:DUF1700 domain-containing protein n=1 Tax=Zunongwangia profunda TaxID=398743 RepID=A0A3D5IX55_9FLAO|nr:hypothetical protein [Zunongwangia profunda]MAO34614.1 hypothetical protein [Zunongwangia sp.]HCV79832.1 hypothetical protein [Zunongwangia profunda]|tara:strand:+ start:930 stop:1517 length:588 start_codon:yes stop_codon:yes gene_type:complete
MKPIKFEHKTAQKIYDDYMSKVKRAISSLNRADREEILMELNSHIYEGMSINPQKQEVEKLVDILDNLGTPEEILKPLVAQKKLEEATATFNPFHIVKALFLNMTNGIVYIFFALLYLVLFGFVFLIVEKIRNPQEVGLYFKNGNFHLLGTRKQSSLDALGLTEVLGGWFIPVMVLSIIVFYILITLLLRLKKKL